MLLQSSTLASVDLNMLTSQGISLIIYSPNMMNDYSFRQYCSSFEKQVDRIILISALNNLVHVYGEIYHPNWITLYDNNRKWVSQYSHVANIDRLVDELRCKELWINGQIIYQCFQPLTNQWYHFKKWLKYHPDSRSWISSICRSKEDEKWLAEQISIESTSLFYSGVRQKFFGHPYRHITNALQWYKLIPISELKKFAVN